MQRELEWLSAIVANAAHERKHRGARLNPQNSFGDFAVNMSAMNSAGGPGGAGTGSGSGSGAGAGSSALNPWQMYRLASRGGSAEIKGDGGASPSPSSSLAQGAGASASASTDVVMTAASPACWWQDAVSYNLHDPKLWEGDVVKMGWKCPICWDVCRNVVEHSGSCGAVFCEECILKHLANGTAQCPMCKGAMTPENLGRSTSLRRLMNAYPLRCPACSSWSGEQCKLAKHLSECPQAQLRCTRCDTVFARADMDKHRKTECRMREETCAFCSQDVVHTDMPKHLASICPKVVAPCPNACGEEKIMRCDLKLHLDKVCALATVKCFCQAVVKRSELSAHVADPKHTAAHLGALAQSLTETNARLARVEEERAAMWSKLQPHPGIYVVTAKHYSLATLRVGDLVDALDQGEYYLSRIVYKDRTHVRVHYLGYEKSYDKRLTHAQLAPAFSRSFASRWPAIPDRFDRSDFDSVRNWLTFDFDMSAQAFKLQRTQLHVDGGWSCCMQQDRNATSCET